ncbi:MAG: hypothetical protein HRF49_03830 [bacterium]|jgi:hypothetical protein
MKVVEAAAVIAVAIFIHLFIAPGDAQDRQSDPKPKWTYLQIVNDPEFQSYSVNSRIVIL